MMILSMRMLVSQLTLETFKRLLDEFMLEVNRLNFGIYQMKKMAH